MNKNEIPSVVKTIELINELAIQAQSQAQLSAKLAIPMSTAYRILCSLKSSQWVRKNPDSTYQLDYGLLSLNADLQRNIYSYEATRPVVENLAAQHHVSCKLSIRLGNRQYTLFRAEPENEPVSLAGRPGSNFPLVEGSVGAALLWRETPENIRTLCRNCPENIREKTEPEHLLDLVAQIIDHGYALNRTIRRWPISAMSAPFAGPGGAVAALTLIGAESDFAGRAGEKYGKILLKAVNDCEKFFR